jgi:hypothetical protein
MDMWVHRFYVYIIELAMLICYVDVSEMVGIPPVVDILTGKMRCKHA